MVKKATALVSEGMRRRTEQSPMLLGVDLQDAKEEVFVRMVTDGISMGVAFARAGFKSKHNNAPSNLWQLDRIQERAAAILEARRTTGVVTLPQVTSMLQRVFSSAYHADEYNAAHNAALSLARLYGHVNDRQTLEIIRRPSRDPDAPNEQELSSWVEALPGLAAPDQASFLRIGDAPTPEPSDLAAEPASGVPLPSSPAPLLAQPAELIDWTASHVLPTSATASDLPNDINDLPVDSTSVATTWREAGGKGVGGRPENGAPTGPVTVTPTPRAHSEPLGPPRKKKQVPVPAGGFPAIEDLF
jgi:hypothetical protein